jgi:hypothetical protein
MGCTVVEQRSFLHHKMKKYTGTSDKRKESPTFTGLTTDLCT